jgi:hypothetical protein
MEVKVDYQAISRISDEIDLLLHQFIRCSEDVAFDKHNPFEDSCDSCSSERDIIMSLLENYRKSFQFSTQTIPSLK